VASITEGPPAIDQSLPGLEEVKMQEQPMEAATGSPFAKYDLIPATASEELFIDEPLPGLGEDIEMQDQLVVNESVHPKSVLSTFHSQTKNNSVSVLQRCQNSNKSVRPSEPPAAADLFTRTKSPKRRNVWIWSL
jgi:hypothetical protein